MAGRRPTPSVEGREEKVKALVKRMSEGVTAVLASPKAWRQALVAQVRFRQYSLGNQLLIISQCPSATQVAGYGTWRTNGRQVRKGEKGIGVLAPVTVLKTVENEDGEETKKPVLVGWKVEYVFDIAQTGAIEGRGPKPVAKPRPAIPAPTIAPMNVVPAACTHDDAWDALSLYAAGKGLEIKVKPLEPTLGGWYHPTDREIVVNADRSLPERVKTLAHEIAHSILHPLGYNAGENPKPRPQAEMEAESAAYVVVASLGLIDAGHEWRSFEYVAGWNPKPKEVLEAGERIGKAARAMIEFIQAALAQGMVAGLGATEKLA